MVKALKVGLVVAAMAAVGIFITAAPAFAQGEETAGITVLSVEISPAEPQLGEAVTVTASVRNPGETDVKQLMEVSANGQVVASGMVELRPGETQELDLSFVASGVGNLDITVGDVTKTVTVIGTQPANDQPAQTDSGSDSEGKMRVGPSVRLDTRQNQINRQQDAVIDLFWNNSSLNDRAVNIEVMVDVPAGLYMYSQDGAMACAAGRCLGTFTAPPGSVRNMPITVKADREGDYFIHLNGRYWPEDDRDDWTPMSLSTPIKVDSPSANPSNAAPSQGADGTASEGGKRWWLTPMALVVWSLLAVVLIALGAFRAIYRSVRAARSNEPTIEIG